MLPSVTQTDYRKAAKRWVCCECGKIIEIGELHEDTKGKWDRFYNFRTCAPCAEDRALCAEIGGRFDADGEEVAWVFGGLAERLREMIDEAPPGSDSAERLLAAYREYEQRRVKP